MAHAEPAARSPMKSPSYPVRTHTSERPQWRSLLELWDQKIAAAGAELAGAVPDSLRGRLYVQMLGARDQIAHAARRLPMEVGDLYEEDHHRLNEAVAALERIFARWGAGPFA